MSPRTYIAVSFFLSSFILSCYIYLKDSYQEKKVLQNISSRGPASENFALSNLKIARSYFKRADYKKAISLFLKILNQDAFSSSKEEIYYYLAKSYFLIDQNPATLSMIYNLEKEYPESYSYWKGLSLLVKARIYEQKNYLQKASQIYQDLINNYKHEDILFEAETRFHNIQFQ